MTNQYKNEITIVRLLKQIYTNKLLRTSLVFRGESAAHLFYNQPKFSTNLDFMIIVKENRDIIYEELRKIIRNFSQQTIKVNIMVSKQALYKEFDLKNYLGIPMLVAKKDKLMSGKSLYTNNLN